MNAKREVSISPGGLIVVGTLLVAVLANVLAGILFMAAIDQMNTYEQESAAVVAPLAQQRDANALAAKAKTVLADSGIAAGKGNIETIYATTPDKLTIVTSYEKGVSNEEARAVAVAAWDAGLGEIEGLENVEVMVKDADGLNTPLFMLSEDEI